MGVVIEQIQEIAGRLSHAYVTDSDTAETLAAAVVCGVRNDARPCMGCANCIKARKQIHPDIIFVKKGEGKREILVDQVREIKQDAYILPNDAAQKVYVIEEAETMNASAQNALLQILEEPPAHTVFILTTANPFALLPTVRSRCVEVNEHILSKFGEEGTKQSNALESEHDSSIVEFSYDFLDAIDDNVKLVEVMFRLDKLDRPAFEEFILCNRKEIASRLRAGPDSLQKKLLHADSLLLKAGEMLDLYVSVGHVSGLLCASLLENTKK